MAEKIEMLVVATDEWEKALATIARKAVEWDDLEIHYKEKYAPTVEYLLRILRKGFGWIEYERGTKEVENLKCQFDNFGKCENEATKGKNCTTVIRQCCKHYQKKFSKTMIVNYVAIEKVGQIKGL